MNAAHLHLLINHLPVIGTLFALLLLAYGLGRGKEDVVKASLWALVIAAVAGAAAYLTGEPAEEVVERVGGVSETLIERHEEAALWATIGTGLVGLFALAGLLLHRGREVSRGFGAVALAATLFVVGGMAWTANLGGQIRHLEIRSGAQGTVPTEIGRGERDDDDD